MYAYEGDGLKTPVLKAHVTSKRRKYEEESDYFSSAKKTPIVFRVKKGSMVKSPLRIDKDKWDLKEIKLFNFPEL